MLPALELELKRRLERELAAGRGQASDYVCAMPRTGRPPHQRTLTAAVTAAGLGHVTSQDLRRSFATIAASRIPDPAEAARMTGHLLDVWVRHYVGRGGPAQRADARGLRAASARSTTRRDSGPTVRIRLGREEVILLARGGPARWAVGRRALAMDRSEPQPLQDIVARLSEHAAWHNLATRAVEGCRGWFLNEPDDLPYSLADVRMEFWSHALYFRSTKLSYPYIDTRLSLRVGERDVGYYRLITLLDGTVDDDYLVFE